MSCGEYVPVWKLRQIIGNEAAEIVIEAFGGRTVYAAPNPTGDSELVRAIGLEAAETLGQAFASFPARGLGRGCQLEIPLGEGSSYRSIQRRLISMIEEDRTTAEISRELGVHERTIRRWRRRINDDLPKPSARLAAMKIAAE